MHMYETMILIRSVQGVIISHSTDNRYRINTFHIHVTISSNHRNDYIQFNSNVYVDQTCLLIKLYVITTIPRCLFKSFHFSPLRKIIRHVRISFYYNINNTWKTYALILFTNIMTSLPPS